MYFRPCFLEGKDGFLDISPPCNLFLLSKIGFKRKIG